MNYQNFASYNNSPPYYGKEKQAYYDRGSGIPNLTEDNMTIQDVFKTPFLFLNDHPKDYKSTVNKGLSGIACNTGLEKLYFSDRNIRRVQDKIKKAIRDRTNGQFRLDEDQDPRDLHLAMKSVYIEHARPKSGGIVRQVKWLNNQVIDEVIPGIITNVRQYYGYLKDINSPLKPIPRPLNVSSAGRKTLPSVTTIFH